MMAPTRNATTVDIQRSIAKIASVLSGPAVGLKPKNEASMYAYNVYQDKRAGTFHAVGGSDGFFITKLDHNQHPAFY